MIGIFTAALLACSQLQIGNAATGSDLTPVIKMPKGNLSWNVCLHNIAPSLQHRQISSVLIRSSDGYVFEVKKTDTAETKRVATEVALQFGIKATVLRSKKRLLFRNEEQTIYVTPVVSISR